MKTCACGCGEAIPAQTGRGRPRKYVPEHAPDKRVRRERRQPRVLKLEPGEADRPEAITTATRSRLEACERLETPEAAVALHLAKLIDVGDYNAQGAAALAKAWAEALGRATLGTKERPDLIDELRARRAARLAAGRR